jgi:Flp pilus assembly protein TadD
VKVRQKLAEDHPDRLASQHVLAGAYLANGQISEAVATIGHVAKMRQKLAEDHPDRLSSQHELARAYQADGQITKAVKMLNLVVTVKRRKFRNGHPSRTVSEDLLAYMTMRSKQ